MARTPNKMKQLYIWPFLYVSFSLSTGDSDSRVVVTALTYWAMDGWNYFPIIVIKSPTSESQKCSLLKKNSKMTSFCDSIFIGAYLKQDSTEMVSGLPGRFKTVLQWEHDLYLFHKWRKNLFHLI